MSRYSNIAASRDDASLEVVLAESRIGSVSLQASVMSFADSFLLVAIVFLCTMPLILLLGKVKPGGGCPAAEAH